MGEGTPIRVQTPLYARLTAEATARGVSPTWLVNKLLSESLDRLAPAEAFSLTRPRAEDG
jgi:hypothetical protein